MSRIVYVSGPITGIPAYNLPAFHRAESELRAHGYRVLSPARIEGDYGTWSWERWMRSAISMMMEAHGVALLDGWLNSRGAQIEYRIAQDLGMPAGSVDAWLNVGAK